MGIADNSPMGKLMVTMLLAFAEFERDMIVERTQTGRTRYREECVKAGEPLKDRRPRKFTDAQLKTALDAIDSGKSYTKAESDYKISKSTLIRARRAQRAEAKEEE